MRFGYGKLFKLKLRMGLEALSLLFVFWSFSVGSFLDVFWSFSVGSFLVHRWGHGENILKDIVVGVKLGNLQWSRKYEVADVN